MPDVVALRALLAQRQNELRGATAHGSANVIADLRGKIASLQRQIAAAGQAPSSAPAALPPGGGTPSYAAPTSSGMDYSAFAPYLQQFNPRSQEEIDQLAQIRANAAITPERLSLERAQQMAGIATQGNIQSVQGFSQALMPYLQQIGPATQQGYEQAAQTTQGLASGFSQGFRDAVASNEQQANAKLAALGAPAGQQINGGAGAGDVLYGLTGYIPGSTLAREGAAFGAAASRLPATSAGLAQEQVGKIAHTGLEQQADFSRSLSELAGRVPSLLADYRGQLEDTNFQRAQAGFGSLMDLQQFGEQRRQFDTSFGEQQRQFDVGTSLDVRQLDEQIRQFDVGARQATTQANRDWYLDRKNLAVQQRESKINEQLTAIQMANYGIDNARAGASAGVSASNTAADNARADRAAAISEANTKADNARADAAAKSGGTSATAQRAKAADASYQGALTLARSMHSGGVGSQLAYARVYNRLLTELGGTESNAKIIQLWRRALVAAGYTGARNAPSPTSRSGGSSGGGGEPRFEGI